MPTPFANHGGAGCALARRHPDSCRVGSGGAASGDAYLPIVFVIIPDPVGAGFVDSLSRPGGNATGFMQFEFNWRKWPALLKEIAPGMTRAAVLRDPHTSKGSACSPPSKPRRRRSGWKSSRSMCATRPRSNAPLGPSRAPEWRPDRDGERAAEVHRDLVILLAARHKLPAVYSTRFFVTGGGLVSYGPDFVDQHRRAATYVDRILKGEKPAGQDFRSAKALFVPSLKHDIVPSIACTRPPVGGFAWQSTSDGGNSYSHCAVLRRHGRSRCARSSRRYLSLASSAPISPPRLPISPPRSARASPRPASSTARMSRSNSVLPSSVSNVCRRLPWIWFADR